LSEGESVGDDFEKKNPASACRKKKIACSTKGVLKKILQCCKKETKKAISRFMLLYKIPANLQPFSLAPF